jgi:hypothetical protein
MHGPIALVIGAVSGLGRDGGIGLQHHALEQVP